MKATAQQTTPTVYTTLPSGYSNCTASGATIINIAGNTNLSTVTALPGTSYSTSTTTIYINNVLTVDKNFSFINMPNILMGPDAQIVILDGYTLTLDNTHLRACSNYMWKGIVLASGSSLTNPSHLICTSSNASYYSNHTLIEDAQIAISSLNDGGYYNIDKQTTFNNNNINEICNQSTGMRQSKTTIIQRIQKTASILSDSKKLLIYPNPSTTNLIIESNNSIQQVSITNLIGQVVVEKEVNTNRLTRFSMFINAGNSSISSVEFKLGINNDGVLFTTWPISNDSLPSLGPPVYAPNFIYKPQKPQINFTQVITDTLNWTELTQDFVADSAYQYITIGNFYSDAQTTVYTIDDTTSILGAQTEAYQLFDDISLYDLGVDGLQGIKQAAILISPNPCSDLLKVNYSTEIKVVSMYSIIGNCVYSQLVNNNQTTIDTHLLPTGIYTLKCETTNAVITKKIIVQQ